MEIADDIALSARPMNELGLWNEGYRQQILHC